VSKPASSWAELEKQIMAKVNSALEVEMAEMVKIKTQEHVQSDVYDAYPDPSIYERRELSGGSLGDIEQMDSKLIESGLLEVVDNADFNHGFAARYGGYGGVNRDKSLAQNIEFGYGNKSMPWNEERPFIAKTKKEIQDNNLHTKTMRSALIKRGLTVV